MTMVMSLCPYLLVNILEAAARHRHSLLRLLLSLLRLVVGSFCFVLAGFLFEFDDLHIRSAVAQSQHGSSVLHTLLHVAQWPCVPSGVTSTFAPQSSHFGLAILSQQANNFKCQAEFRGGNREEMIRYTHATSDTTTNNAHDMHVCKQHVQGCPGREELVIIPWQSCIRAGGPDSKKGGLSLLRLITLLMRKVHAPNPPKRGLISPRRWVMAKQRFRYPRLQGALHIL
jgi:hypothetical protein